MGSNTLGQYFQVTLYGESHGECVGVIIDGVPAGFPLDLEEIQQELTRRRPGQSEAATARSESDEFTIRSGFFEKATTGAPLCLEIPNKDVDSSSYYATRYTPRPSHSDLSAFYRYGGFHDFRGSGRFSGRMTAGLVMAGTIARQLLRTRGIELRAYTRTIGDVVDETNYSISEIDEHRETNPLRAVDPAMVEQMLERINQVKADHDSIGGVIHCRVENMVAGVGDPFFNTLESTLAYAIFAIPAVRGVEFGAGFRSTTMRGSEHNDQIIMKEGKLSFRSNNAGGIVGGISTGAPIEFNVAIKPTASIGKEQHTVNLQTMEPAKITIKGRHDPVIVPRAVPVVEATTAIVLVDFLIGLGHIPIVIQKEKGNG